MSLITRCPACGTTFKVVQDQLRISDGWVRCGRCSQVFDATADLHEASGSMPAAAPTPGERTAAVASEPLLEEAPPPAPAEANADAVAPCPSLSPFPDIDLTLAAVPPMDHDSAQAKEEASREAKDEPHEPTPVVLVASEPEPWADVIRHAPGPSAAGSAVVFWQRATARRSLWMAAVLATVLLVAQVLRQERDLIAAHQPALRPVLTALCGLTGCELSALRRIGDITIDGASFAHEGAGDAYRFSFTLRNAAAMALAMPAIELSLLDTQERAVVRRVLLPSDFGAPPVLPARAERAVSLPLAIAGPEAEALPPVAGYKVVAFYP